MANQAWQIDSPSVLSLNTLSSPIPKPGPNQVLVRVHAVSLNFRDFLVADHNPKYPFKHKKGLIPCSDAAGIVEDAGPESLWKKGDAVIVLVHDWVDGDSRNWNANTTLGAGDCDGSLRRWMVRDDNQITRAPSNISLEEAATLFTAGLTAYRALFAEGFRPGPGTTVLTQGTGGVSCFGIQLASAAGATVIATSSSEKKLAVAKRLGATHTINYRTTPEWGVEALRLTDDKGVDFVLDVGGSGTIEQSLQAARQGGTVTVVGLLTDSKPADLIPLVLFGGKSILGQLGAGSHKTFKSMIDFVEEHDIHPQIAKVFDFEEADKAFEYTRNLQEVGKVVVKC